MRALFSLVGLLLVVAIVMLVAKKQLQAVVPALAPPMPTAVGGAAPTAPEPARSAQQKVLQDVSRALEQGAARASEAQQ